MHPGQRLNKEVKFFAITRDSIDEALLFFSVISRFLDRLILPNWMHVVI